MKHGAKRSKKNKFLENVVIATIYFAIFSFFVLVTGEMNNKVFSNPTISNLILYDISILAMLVFLILFISAWDNCFESEDHP